MAVKFTSNLPTTLKEEVEQTFGRPVFTAKDCIQLSSEIYLKTRVQISPHTLRRLFGLVKVDTAPSTSTLNILAKYCGFSSVSDVPQSVCNPCDKKTVHAENVLNFLLGLFNEVPLHQLKWDDLLCLVKNMTVLLNREPTLAYSFQRKIAKTLNGQVLYFERFIYLDKLNDYYGDCLKYYMQEKKTLEAECFGYSLLVLRYWLTGEDQKLCESFWPIQQIPQGKLTDPALLGRYYAAKLLFAHVAGHSIEKVIYDIHKYHLNISAQKEKKYEFPIFEYLVSSAMVLTGKYREAIYFLEFGPTNHHKELTYGQLGYYQLMMLYKAIALVETGEQQKAEKLYNKMKPTEFTFLSKKLSMILLLLLAGRLKKNVHKKNDIFYALVADTGFSRLISLI